MRRLGRMRSGLMPVLSLLLVPFVVSSSEAQAVQEARITGTVTSEQGNPVGFANIVLAAMNMGTQANERGEYTLVIPANRATGQTVAIQARFIGFTQQTQNVALTPGTQTVNFVLSTAPFRLGETVVTGVGTETESTKLTFSVAKLSEEQLTTVPATSPIQAIAGKVAGARVSLGRGNPGSPPTIRLRGSTNLGIGGSQPLVIIDGVVTAASIADIDANDIESVEILKGAAGASYYGSNAANGVISITTRRGRNIQDNSISYTLRTEYGSSDLENYVPIATARQGTTGFLDDPYPTSGADRWRNQVKEWTQSGDFMLTNLQVGGRSGSTNFNTSFTYDRNAGILPLKDGQKRQNVRLNVDQGIGALADVSFGVTYGINRNDYNPDGSTAWFSLLQAPQNVDLEFPFPDQPRFYPYLQDLSPSARENPLNQLQNAGFDLRRERIIGAASMRYRPLDWLRLEASYGTDRSNVRQQTYTPRGALGELGQSLPGSIRRDTEGNVADNSAVSATASYSLMENIRGTSRVSALYEQVRYTGFFSGGTRLVVGAVPDLSAIDPTVISTGSTDQLARTINYLASQAFDIRDRYLLDFMVRQDRSSLFGPNEREANFYRVSGAWRISEDFEIPGVQELKLRAARGTAGLRPTFAGQYETYSLVQGQLNKNQIGNLSLKPAVQTENEFGLNMTFANRFDLELVQANRKTVGAFLNVPLSVAAGGFATQYRNAADVEAQTTEVSFQANVLNRPDFSYSLTLTGDRTRQEITRMDRAAFRVNAGGQGQDVFYYAPNETLGIIYGARWVRSTAELTEMGLDPSLYEVNPLGFMVLSANRGTTAERPVRFVDATGQNQFKIGDVNPDFSFGFGNNLRWRNFSLYALFDGQQGGDVYNFTKQWMFQDHRHADADMTGVPDNQKIANAFFAAGLYNGLVASDYFVEDASFVKFRELSLAYNFSNQMLDRVGLGRLTSGMKVALIGRNLKTWTSYSGFDPEVTSGGDFNFRIDGFRYPNFRTITGQVEIRF
jgi:TonB-linked SusC/RagA family outer membrane protein